MRKTTNGRRIRHIKIERDCGYIVKSAYPAIKIGTYVEVETPKPVDGKRNWTGAMNDAYDKAVAISQTLKNPFTGDPLPALIIPKILKTSHPIKLY